MGNIDPLGFNLLQHNLVEDSDTADPGKLYSGTPQSLFLKEKVPVSSIVITYNTQTYS